MKTKFVDYRGGTSQRVLAVQGMDCDLRWDEARVLVVAGGAKVEKWWSTHLMDLRFVKIVTSRNAAKYVGTLGTRVRGVHIWPQ